MPNIASTAISNIVYYFGNPPAVVVSPGVGLTVVNTAADLAGIAAPDIDDAAIVKIGTNGGYDIAVYTNTGWVIKPTRGIQGIVGPVGAAGNPGGAGQNGINGTNGANGAPGTSPEYQWLGTTIRFKMPDGTWGPYVDLKGANGANGMNGLNGARGAIPAHSWAGTNLRFANPDGTWGPYVDLRGTNGSNGIDGIQGIQGQKGEQGATGLTGPRPNHEFNGTSVRFQLPNGTWGVYVNLKGEAGAAPSIDPISGNWFIGGVDTGVPAIYPNRKEEIEFDGTQGETITVDLTPARITKFGSKMHIDVWIDNANLERFYTSVPIQVVNNAGNFQYIVFVGALSTGMLVLS